MNNSGDAAEQIVRMSLEGVEFAARITGTAAKELALLLITAIKSNKDKDHTKLRGKERLKTMLKSGKPLEVYSIKERDLSKFVDGAKEYGIVYCVLRNSKSNPDGLCDIMVKADDAPKIARLSERYKISTVDKATIDRNVIPDKTKNDNAPHMNEKTEKDSEPEAMQKDKTEQLLDELLGTQEGKTDHNAHDASTPKKLEPNQSQYEKPKPNKTSEVADTRPLATAENRNQSATISEHGLNSAGDSLNKSGKPSVKQELREIAGSQKQEKSQKHKDITKSNKSKRNPPTTHQQPQRGGRNKKAKTKGTR